MGTSPFKTTMLARLVLTTCVLLAACASASAAKLALVIGNQDYVHLPDLQKALGDAEEMKKALERLGFTVTSVQNLNERAFKLTILDFAQRVEKDDEVVIHCSGHGVAIDERNYLMPVDIEQPQPGQEARVPAFAADAALMV